MELRVDGSQLGGAPEVTYMRPYDAKKSCSIDGGKYVIDVLSRVCVIIERANDDVVNAVYDEDDDVCQSLLLARV